MLFLSVQSVYGCSFYTLLSQYGNDNWNWYIGIRIGILEVELVFVIGLELEMRV